MGINVLQMNKLAAFETASWALWSPEFNKRQCLEAKPHLIRDYLAKRIDELKNNVVLIGLNRSFNEKKAARASLQAYPTFANFHAASHSGDGLLKETIGSLPNLQGAYMSDLCLDMQSKSAKVNINEKAAMRRLNEQLRILGGASFHIVCFGASVFRFLATLQSLTAEALEHGVLRIDLSVRPGQQLLCYKVIHYSYAVRYNRRERFKKQMSTVNDLIGGL